MTDCKPCDDGYYGETTGLEVSTCTGKCSAGFYCNYVGQGQTIGATVHSPEDGTLGNRCAAGTYCPEGSYQETPCENGSYQPNNGQSSCLTCPIGSFCPEGSVEPVECPVGYYCEIGTGSTSILIPNPDGSGTTISVDVPTTKCPAGLYQPETGRDRCLTCPPGYFCQSEGITAIDDSTMKCSPGYYCTSGSVTATPIGRSYGNQCDAGYYCDEGSAF